MTLKTYSGKPPREEEVTAKILRILSSTKPTKLKRVWGYSTNGTPVTTIAELKRHVCPTVTAPSFHDLLCKMESEELVSIWGFKSKLKGGGNRPCAIWGHPESPEGRQLEYQQRADEQQRRYDIENAPRLAVERMQREFGMLFVDNSDLFIEAVIGFFQRNRPRKTPWLYSREIR